MERELMKLYVNGRTKLIKAMERFYDEERGASEMVTVVMLIVIVIGFAVTFKDALEPAIERIFSNFSGFIDGSSLE